MANVRALMDGGINFERAILGHMAAETVITHNVLTSGRLPKNMGWVNEVYRDVDGVLGPARLLPGDLEPRLRPVRDAAQGPGLPQARRPARRQVHLRRPEADGGVHRRPSGRPRGHRRAHRQPQRRLRPRHELEHELPQPGGLQSRATSVAPLRPLLRQGPRRRRRPDDWTYGTGTTSPAWMYPLDGNRFAVGTTPRTSAATSGPPTRRSDDGARDGLARDDGHARLRRQGRAHVGHGRRRPVGRRRRRARAGAPAVRRAHRRPAGRPPPRRARRAGHPRRDARRPDHGPRGPDRAPLPRPGRLDRGNFNWYYGADSDETYQQPQPALAPLVATGNVDFSYQDGHIATWLDDRSPAKLDEAAARCARCRT